MPYVVHVLRRKIIYGVLTFASLFLQEKKCVMFCFALLTCCAASQCKQKTTHRSTSDSGLFRSTTQWRHTRNWSPVINRL